MPYIGFQGPASDYIKQREARRTGRKPNPMSKYEKELRSNIERDIRAEIERHDRALNEQKHKKKISASKKERRAWWQFWKRSKLTKEGW